MNNFYVFLTVGHIMIFIDLIGIIVCIMDIVMDTECDAIVIDVLMIIFYSIRLLVLSCVPICYYFRPEIGYHSTNFDDYVISYMREFKFEHKMVATISCFSQIFFMILFFWFKNGFSICHHWIFELLVCYVSIYSAMTIACIVVTCCIFSYSKTRTTETQSLVDDDHA